jgi:hypothetical protein
MHVSAPAGRGTGNEQGPAARREVAIVTGGAKGIVSPSARNITGHDVPVDAGWDV